jgi:hypothetical protein
MTGRERWRGPLALFREIAAAPSYDELLVRWEGFDRAARWFRRETYGQRRDPHGRMWHGHRGPRLDIRDAGLKLAMQEVIELVVNNPAFDDPRAAEMRSRLLELMLVNWAEKAP